MGAIVGNVQLLGPREHPDGIVRAETQFNYTAPIGIMAGATTTVAGMVGSNTVGGTAIANTGSVVGTTTTIGRSTATQRTITDVVGGTPDSTPSGGGGDVTAKYRVAARPAARGG